MRSEHGNVQNTPPFTFTVQSTIPVEITSEWLAQLNRHARLHQLTWALSPTNIRLNYCPLPYLLFVIPVLLCLVSYTERQISFGVVGIVFGISWGVYIFKIEKLKATTGLALMQGLQILQATEDKQAALPLAGALKNSVPLIAQGIESALTRLLPQLKASDQALLDVNARQNLHHALNGNHNNKQEFLLVVIRCLQTIGDVGAVPALKRITARNVGAASVNIPIYLAAEACLKTLESHWAEHQESQTLVRASDVASVPGETLLRPASDAQDNSVEELLHPSQAETRENKSD